MIDLPNLYLSGELQHLIKPEFMHQALVVFCETVGLSSSISVSLVLCSSEEMQKVNSKYRGVDATTDVLSFPAGFEPGMFPSDEKGEIYLGEILIDINYLKSQTTTNDIHKEIIPVFIHGLLHLTGYDHMNTQQKTLMQAMEHKILELIIQDGSSD